MYNKNQYKKCNTKMILHKIKKQWVTISVALFLLLSGGIAIHINASANTNNQATTTNQEVNINKASQNKINNSNNNKSNNTNDLINKASNLHKNLILQANSNNMMQLGSHRSHKHNLRKHHVNRRTKHVNKKATKKYNHRHVNSHKHKQIKKHMTKKHLRKHTNKRYKAIRSHKAKRSRKNNSSSLSKFNKTDLHGTQYEYLNPSDDSIRKGQSEKTLARFDAAGEAANGNVKDSDGPKEDVGDINYLVRHFANKTYLKNFIKYAYQSDSDDAWNNSGEANNFKKYVIGNLNKYAHGSKLFRIGWLDGDYDDSSYFNTHYINNPVYKAGWLSGSSAEHPDKSNQQLLDSGDYMNIPKLEHEIVDGQNSVAAVSGTYSHYSDWPSHTWLSLKDWWNYVI